MDIYGIAVLAGIGFTMSIFIAQLAFAQDPTSTATAKFAVLCASILSGLLGLVVIHFGQRLKKLP